MMDCNAPSHSHSKMADADGSCEVKDQQDGGTEVKAKDEEVTVNQVMQESKTQKVSENASHGKKSAKKKKKSKKVEGATAAADDEQGASKQSDMTPAAVNMQTLKQIQKAMEQLMAAEKPARTRNEAKQRKYEFWDTQPVPKIGMLNL